MKTDAGPSLLLCCLLLAGYVAPANAQFKLQQSFEGTSAPGWTFSDSAMLTAPSIDAAGSGWLRLTAAVNSETGEALNTGFSFTSNQPVVVRFNYVSWGGSGADGMTVFLYDSSNGSPMMGAVSGGGLGYCGGAGGYLGIGLDEYGNFSDPTNHCGYLSGGPGRTPESLVIRGPESAHNYWVNTTVISGGIDNPGVFSRPAPKTVQLTLTPATVGYTITAQFQSASGEPFQTLFSNVAFTYAPPANLSVGFSGSTGGSNNNHELQGLVAATPDDVQVTMTGPSSALQGSAVTYAVTVTNNGNHLLGTGNAPTVADTLPVSITGATWTCVGAGGGTCGASGTGNINTTNLTLPANGSVTYTIVGTLSSTATCGSSVANTANADFSSSTSFLDPDETNNTATVISTVTCDNILVANPASLAYSPQQLQVASNSKQVTLTEGSSGGAHITSIAITGDYHQTNNCPATLANAQTCTINVVFTPTAVGSRNGTLTISSNLTGSPTVATVVPLTGTGINSIPSPFSFTPLIDVDPSSVQVSNSITVASTDVPAPISVSNGGQYSVNGGNFTSAAGVVSPGAQVQLQLTAASGYSTSDSAVLTIGGVTSTFTVTTGTPTALTGGFTPVTNAVPNSIQTSNAITVAGTTMSVPISVSSGAEYSINGAPYTGAPGTVQPGDQVTVQMTTPSTYNTTTSAVVTIGGVTSTYTVTTGTPTALQGGFTPVTNAVPNSIQTSNAISVAGTIMSVPISVSSGAEYSINGAAFTSAPGTVQPGDQVTVQMTTPSTYNTTASAVVTIGGVTSTYTVTTGAQRVPQAAFTAVTGASVSSTQISNAITVTSITAPASISIGGGAEYSINGGPFTATAGTVKPGDQLRVRVTAPSTYGATATSVLTIGGTPTSFVVTTGEEPVVQGSFTAVSGAQNSSAQTSDAIAVTGITSPAAISITSGAEYSINGGAFTSAPGTVQAGDKVTVRVTAPSTYSTTATAVLDIDGVDIKYSVTTGVQPLQAVAVTGGGGAIGTVTLLMLALLASLKAVGPRRAARLLPLVVAFLAAISSVPARADNGYWWSNIYGGLRVGESTSSMTASKLTGDLRDDGYRVTAAGDERGTTGGTLYLGYELRNNFAVEIAGTYIGRTRAALEGVLPANLGPLLADTAHIVRGSGDIVALEARYRWPLTQAIDLDLRAGPYLWLTTADVYVSGVDKLNRSDNGLGYTLGVGPRFALGQHVGIGVSAEYFNSTSQNQFWQFSGTLEYHFR